jgi:hypothetical protein
MEANRLNEVCVCVCERDRKRESHTLVVSTRKVVNKKSIALKAIFEKD